MQETHILIQLIVFNKYYYIFDNQYLNQLNVFLEIYKAINLIK
jgi:hypothetical protein